MLGRWLAPVSLKREKGKGKRDKERQQGRNEKGKESCMDTDVILKRFDAPDELREMEKESLNSFISRE